jgi:hypothetical protein
MINQNNYNHFQKYYPTFVNLNFNDKITILNQMKKMNYELFIIYKKAFHMHFGIDFDQYLNNHTINNKSNNYSSNNNQTINNKSNNYSLNNNNQPINNKSNNYSSNNNQPIYNNYSSNNNNNFINNNQPIYNNYSSNNNNNFINNNQSINNKSTNYSLNKNQSINNKATNYSLNNNNDFINNNQSIDNKIKINQDQEINNNIKKNNNQTIINLKKIDENKNKFAIIPHFSNNIPRHLSIPKINFEDFVYNKKIIIVGPSNHILDRPNGEWIEKFDIIIRLNKSLPIRPDLYPFIGRRTDILYNNLNVSDYPGENRIDIDMFLNSGVRHLVCPYPPIEPFTPDILNFIKNNKGIIPFRHIDLNYYRKIENKLGTRPNTGISAIADILNFNIKELYITGISFFKKNYYKQYRNLTKSDLLNVANNSIHIQKPQKLFLRSLYLNDDRIKVDNLLKEIIYEYFEEFEMIPRKYEKDVIFLNINQKIIKDNIYRKIEKYNKILFFINKNNLNRINKNKYFFITDNINFPINDLENILYLIGNFEKNITKKIDIDIKLIKNFDLLVMSETKNIILKKWDKKNIYEKIFFINKKLSFEQKRVMEKGHFNITNYIIYMIYLLGIIFKAEVNIFRDDFELLRSKMTFYEITLMKYLIKENKINILE